jgi:hypothetical protein
METNARTATRKPIRRAPAPQKASELDRDGGEYVECDDDVMGGCSFCRRW